MLNYVTIHNFHAVNEIFCSETLALLELEHSYLKISVWTNFSYGVQLFEITILCNGNTQRHFSIREDWALKRLIWPPSHTDWTWPMHTPQYKNYKMHIRHCKQVLQSYTTHLILCCSKETVMKYSLRF